MLISADCHHNMGLDNLNGYVDTCLLGEIIQYIEKSPWLRIRGIRVYFNSASPLWAGWAEEREAIRRLLKSPLVLKLTSILCRKVPFGPSQPELHPYCLHVVVQIVPALAFGSQSRHSWFPLQINEQHAIFSLLPSIVQPMSYPWI